MNNNYNDVIKNILMNSGQLKANEKLLIISDTGTKELADYFENYCQRNNLSFKHITIEPLPMHGAPPPEFVNDEMLKHDLIVCLTSYSLAHSDARKAATDKGKRYLSLPDYSFEVMNSPASLVDYSAQALKCKKLSDILDGGKIVKITSAIGTDLELDISDRNANNCDAFLKKPGALGSPPDIEVNIAPNEYKTKGVIYVDGSIPHKALGVVKSPVKLVVSDGAIVDFASEDSEFLAKLKNLFSTAPQNARILGELGYGLNPLSTLCGRMLEDEGAFGHIHFGFGSNSTIGGINRVGFHLDFVMKEPSCWVDSVQVIKNGEYVF